MEKEPVFKSLTGSTEDPGVYGTIFFERPVSAYAIFVVPQGRLFVLEHVSAAVTRGSLPYPPGNLNDYGAVGYRTASGDSFHFLPFMRSEPNGILLASQALTMQIPAGSQVVVKVPLIPGQSGGACVNVSGYYTGNLSAPAAPSLSVGGAS